MSIFQSVIYYLFILAQLLVTFYIILPLLFILVFSLSRLFKLKTSFEKSKIHLDKDFKFSIVITAYRETKFILPLIDSIKRQNYQNFMVYIVADDCQDQIPNLLDNRINVIIPESPLHSKIKSIDFAVSKMDNETDAIIIFDADNLIHPDFIQTINNYFKKGFKVVQSNFKPKNIETHFARMDAIGDMFNFFMEREVRMYIGISSCIWGAGIAIDYDLYKKVEYTKFLGGFDKKLQSYLVQSVRHIAFAPTAILYDEKISSGASLEKQRTRWIRSYFDYFKENLSILLKGFRKKKINLIFFGFLTLRPPLFLVLSLGFLFTLINFFIDVNIFYIWLCILLSFVLSFVTIILIKSRNIKYLKSLLFLPLLIFRQFIALFNIKKAKKTFLPTEHTALIYITDILKKK
ncbi:MAG: glycosyltransferase [Ignavibacterium sp.]|nr:glycosyltransferase [Ignavibacterium sp.]